MVGTEADNVLLTVLKKHEDNNDIVIRGYETDGKAVTTVLHLPYKRKTYTISFTPHEIKTLCISRRNWTIREVNLLEEPPK
jgi:alpha-mannosidase